MAVFRIEIKRRPGTASGGDERRPCAAFRGLGLSGLRSIRESRLFLIEGDLTLAAARHVARQLLADPVIEVADVLCETDEQPRPELGWLGVEVHPPPGVTDPVAESTLAELRAEGLPVDKVRTRRRFV